MSPRKWSGLLLILLALILPWWISLPLLVGAILFFPYFFEAVAILFILDLIYGAPISGTHIFFSLTIGGLLLVAIVDAFRQALLVRK